MPELRRETIFSGIDGDGIAVRLPDLPGQFLVSGAELAPNSVDGSDPYALWLAPGRSLFVGTTPPDERFVSDVSDGLVVIDLGGPRSDQILAMACPLDPAALAPGRCVQSLFAGVKVLLYRHGEALRLHVERPLAAWLLDWLRQAIGAFERQR